MLRSLQLFIVCSMLISSIFTMNYARQDSNSIADSPPQDLENADSELEEVPNFYYDMPQQIYPSIPMDRLQMLIAQYRPAAHSLSSSNAYLRSPGWNNLNSIYRSPEIKRQARYRQCYFNPISCFKK